MVIGQPSVQFYTPKIIRDLALHLNSLIYAQLTTAAHNSNVDADVALEVIERYRPNLDYILLKYNGIEIQGSWNQLVEDLNTFIDGVFGWE